MRKLFYFVLFSTVLYAQNVRVQDYEVPVSSAQDLRFNGSWDWLQDDSVLTNSARANIIYRAFYSSLPLAWFIDVNANGTKNKAVYGHNIDLRTSINKYIWPNQDLFSFAEIRARHEKDFSQVESQLSLGFGYGRYINATALAKAVRIEDHLLREKIISGHLPKDVMIDIANIIEREGEFRTLYGETYETYWLDAIENEIQKTDKLTEESVGSVGILRMHQVLFNINERVNQRYYGWQVTAGVLFPLTTRGGTAPGNPNAVIGARYSLPLSWRFQVNTEVNIFSPLDISFGESVTAQFRTDFIYELSNKINFLVNYRFDQKIKEVPDHFLISSFLFYLENNIYLTINGDLTKIGRNSSRISTNVGLQYNLF